MPASFTPSDPDEVQDMIEAVDHIHDVSRLGTGLVAVRKYDTSDAHVVDGLTRNHGWRLIMYADHDQGDICVYLPITEVPE